MTAKQVVPGVIQVTLGIVNAFLLVGEDVTIIDSGVARSAAKILQAVRDSGKDLRDVRHILLSHLHADHTGSAKALKDAILAAGGAVDIAMHASDAALFQQGQTMRPFKPAPGLLNKIIVQAMKYTGMGAVESAPVDRLLNDGDELPIAGGLQVIHTPGHSAGHLVFLWPQQGGVLFAGDACVHTLGRLGYPPIFEDFELGLQSLRKLGGMSFENTVFGHGNPLLGGAAQQIHKKWG